MIEKILVVDFMDSNSVLLKIWLFNTQALQSG